MRSRKFGDVELIQIVEFTGPTHDLEWMLPGMPRSAFDANASWLLPDYWVASTNRLVFTMQVVVLKAQDRIILIDTGVGNGKTRISPHQNMINTPVLDWLAAVGAPPDKVTHVVHTHLHGDHVGWDTCRDGDRWVPTFPNAIYLAPADDWTDFKSRHDAGTLGVHDGPFVDSVLPIAEAGLLRFFAPGEEVAGCLLSTAAPGHTIGQVTLSFRHAGEHCIFSADVLHSPMQVQYPDINSRWCEYPDAARATRRALMETVATTEAIVYPAHAFGLDGWRIVRQGDGYAVHTGSRSVAPARSNAPHVPDASNIVPRRVPQTAHG
jgi:glyoxylase-like metal-dependent hydrolase (beta-lactamase superfamily II)